MFEVPWSVLEPGLDDHPPVGFRLLLVDDELLESRAGGRVTSGETLDSRNCEPVPGGLHCTEVFGPTTEPVGTAMLRYSDRLEPFEPCARASRLGVVRLSAPVVHPLVLWHRRDALAEALGLEPEQLQRIADAEASAVVEPGDNPLEPGQLLDACDAPHDARLASGVEALVQLHEDAWGDSPMFLRHIPVLPAALRPMVDLGGGRFAASDLDELYRRLIRCSDRIEQLRALDVHDVVIRHQLRQLQQTVHALFLNRATPLSCDADGRPLCSVFDLAGLGLRPWERLQRLLDEGWDPTESGPTTGPRHWLRSHLSALGLEIVAA